MPADGQDAEQFVVRDLCGGLRVFLKEHADDLLPSLDNEDELWQLLVGVNGQVFRICSHLSASESATGYDAIGAAAPQALGSLASTEGRPPRERVAAPFTVLTVPHPPA